jgi:hypothetical protein
MAGSLKEKDRGPGQPGQKSEILSPTTRAIKVRGVAQAVEYPPSKCKALSSNASAPNNNNY